MSAITHSVVTLANDTPDAGADSPPARRTRTRTRVTVTARSRKAKALARVARTKLRDVAEVVYLDAHDSWLINEQSPSIQQVWSADYTANVPDYAPFRRWCRIYRYPATAAAAVCDGTKWFLVHPVRGPLFIVSSIASAAVGALTTIS